MEASLESVTSSELVPDSVHSRAMEIAREEVTPESMVTRMKTHSKRARPTRPPPPRVDLHPLRRVPYGHCVRGGHGLTRRLHHRALYIQHRAPRLGRHRSCHQGAKSNHLPFVSFVPFSPSSALTLNDFAGSEYVLVTEHAY